jgi:hypothetical protein
MMFSATPTDGSGGGSPAPADKAAADAAAKAAPGATQAVDYKAELLKLLGLDASADDAAIQAKAAEVQGTLGTVGDLQTKASSADQLQQKLDEISAKYAALNLEQEQVYKAKQEADADEILKVYEGHFVDDASKAAIRNILLSDKDAGIAILNGLKKPEAAAPSSDTTTAAEPPAPKHDPANGEMSEDEKIAAGNALIAEIRKEGKFKDFDSARDEARRRKPELFS